jgi:hypothetical protein
MKDIAIDSIPDYIKNDKIGTHDALKQLVYLVGSDKLGKFVQRTYKVSIEELTSISDKTEMVDAIIISFIKNENHTITDYEIQLVRNIINDMKQNKRWNGGYTRIKKRKKNKTKRTSK